MSQPRIAWLFSMRPSHHIWRKNYPERELVTFGWSAEERWWPFLLFKTRIDSNLSGEIFNTLMFQPPLIPENEANDRDQTLRLFSLIFGTVGSNNCVVKIISLWSLSWLSSKLPVCSVHATPVAVFFSFSCSFLGQGGTLFILASLAAGGWNNSLFWGRYFDY